MISPRWQKLRGDLRRSKGRVAMMILAIAISLFGVGTMLTAYTILTREITRNYQATQPASATLELHGAVDQALVEKVRGHAGIADAQAGATVLARVLVGADWLPLLLFVVDDFRDLRLNRFEPEAGAWPPPDGTLLLERSAVGMLQTGIGGTLQIKTPHGQPRAVPVTGLTHDTGLAPAWQERMGYGYISRRTLALLGEAPVFNELRIRVAEHPLNRASIERAVRGLAEELRAQGHAVREIQVPPPGRHPHQGQMEGVLTLFIVFSLMTLGLSGIMVATVVANMLAGQAREIGVMKAVGARTRQIAALYFVMLALLGAVAVVLSLPAGLFAGRKFAEQIGQLLNFTIGSQAVPAWVFGVQVAAGILVPLLVAAGPVLRGCRLTVREAINDYGVNAEGFGRHRLDRWLSAWRGISRLRLLALRNLLRRRGRLLLSVGLLAASGGMFITGLSLGDAWRQLISRVYTERFYDAEIRLNQPEPEATLRAALQTVPGIRASEFWGFSSSTTLTQPGAIDLVRTYPDERHNSFALFGAPPETPLVKFPVLAGRWLWPDDTDGVVLTHMARALVPGSKLGDRVWLSLDGKPTAWRLVGIIEEVGSPAAAYVTREAYARAAGTEGRPQMIRFASTATDPAARLAIIRTAEQALTAAGVSVRLGLPLAELQTAVGDHMAVLIRTLVAAAGLIGVIGVLGLASTTSMNVLERTREIGIMKAVGAKPRIILSMIVTEGVLVGALSWVLAVPGAALLSLGVGRMVGMMSFQVPLALVLSWSAILLWLGLVLVLSALASAYPAWQAARQTVRVALAYG